ncbi:hypothetical protein HZH68_016077 [Vespula germanica]|uniref:Uncharacterized protein n=2 Tax=Vespula TaxID=7451 RepID=A0A834J482_VESGE|nr:hypothetical protein HZH68_016077 [Vespula germanica]KAF7392393.1 hypothetical protein H0235_017392 [Vespula pensylvanica]
MMNRRPVITNYDIKNVVRISYRSYTLTLLNKVKCSSEEKIYNKCEDVVLPKLGDQIKTKEEIFCPRCDCKYENRNTTIIKIVVIIVIWVISLLVIYMLFLICLDPLLNKRIHKNTTNIGYHEHNNEEDDASVAPGSSHPMGERGNVLNRVGHQQDKWKRQVREQRRNIYDRHTMLN